MKMSRRQFEALARTAATRAKQPSRPKEKRVRRPRKESALSVKFRRLWAELDGPELMPEAVFAHPRKWRFDFLHIGSRVAIELDGGVFTRGRHTRGSGFVKDCEKMNMATACNFRVFRLATGMVTEPNVSQILGVIRNG
jgi:very-short-patch-repair endonuclease